MTSNAWNWFLAISGTFASFIGLGFSWRSWIQAKAAKIAALDAVEAARARETAYEFSMLASDAKELLSAVQDARKDRAIAAANDLVHLLTIAITRRRRYLPSNGEIEQRLKNLRAISNDLSVNGFPTDQKEVIILIRRCEQIHATVCQTAGLVESNMEGDSE